MEPRDHAQLPLDLPVGGSLLDGPFTPAMARAAGINRSALDRMHREGRVRRLLRGVYVASTVAETVAVRARAVGLVVPRGAVVVDRTAAWVHGVDVSHCGPEPLPAVEALTPASRGRQLGGRRRLGPGDVAIVDGVAVATPLRTALDLGRLLAPDRAQGVIDAMLRAGLCSHRELLAELPRFGRHPGIVQLRHVVALADARALDAAESALRFHWFAAQLPTPVPGLLVQDAGPWCGPRLSLGLPMQRFGVVVAPSDTVTVAAAAAAVEAGGWRVVVVSGERVLADADLVLRRIEVEFHQQLLRDVG